MTDEQQPTGAPGPGPGPAGPGDEAGTRADDEEVADAEIVDDELEAVVRERDELLDLSRRLQADFENYRKRMLREQTLMVERATEGLVEQLLPVLDSFELAMLQLQDDDVDVDRVRKGVDLVFAEMLGTLERAGLERLGELEEPFDPEVHEAVLQEEGPGEPVVVDVMRPGYRLKGRVVRPAMVKVARTGEATG